MNFTNDLSTKKVDDASLNVEESIKLCINMDCVRYPPDWDFEEDTYQEDQWTISLR